jgi:hypothetical protein
MKYTVALLKYLDAFDQFEDAAEAMKQMSKQDRAGLYCIVETEDDNNAKATDARH